MSETSVFFAGEEGERFFRMSRSIRTGVLSLQLPDFTVEFCSTAFSRFAASVSS